MCYNYTMKKIIILLYASMLAFLIGLVMWLYLSLIKITISYLWHNFTENVFLLVLIPIFGAIIIARAQKSNGVFPPAPNVAMKKYLVDRNYDKPSHIFVGAFTPIVTGGSVGPEASLLSFCYLFGAKAGDRVRKFENKIDFKYEMNMYPENAKILEKFKINQWHSLKILIMLIVGVLSVCVLSVRDSLEGIFAFLGKLTISSTEIAALIPLIIMGVCVAAIYILFGKLVDVVVKPFENRIMLMSIMVGVFISICYLIEPLLLFSGEHEMKVVIDSYMSYTAIFLIVLAIYKLFLTQLCVKTTWRGGHGFPIIFSSTCLGLALSILFGINPLFAVTIIATTAIGIIYSPAISFVVMILILKPNIMILIALFVLYALIPILKKNKLFGDYSGH